MLIGARREIASGALPWPAALIVWGPGAISSGHAHHCVHLVFALRGRLRVRSGTDLWRQCGAVLVAADTPHEIDAREIPVLIAFIDPESDLATAIHLERASIVVVRDSVVARWRRALGDPRELQSERVESWVRSDLLRRRPVPKMHAGVRRVLNALERHPLDRRNISLRKLAEVAGLSPSRFMHLFTQSVGTPLRPYLLWRRVQRASRALAAGHSVTEAAHAAGFADAPHMTRTFQRMLGVTPRKLLARVPASREVSVTRTEFMQREGKAG